MLEFIDPVFAKRSPIIENDRFGLVFAKTGTIHSGLSGAGVQRVLDRWKNGADSRGFERGRIISPAPPSSHEVNFEYSIHKSYPGSVWSST